MAMIHAARGVAFGWQEICDSRLHLEFGRLGLNENGIDYTTDGQK